MLFWSCVFNQLCSLAPSGISPLHLLSPEDLHTDKYLGFFLIFLCCSIYFFFLVYLYSQEKIGIILHKCAAVIAALHLLLFYFILFIIFKNLINSNMNWVPFSQLIHRTRYATRQKKKKKILQL